MKNRFSSNPVATEDPQEMASRLNSFANMMLAKTEEERIAKLYKNPQDTHQDNLVQSRSTPQEPAEGQSRHGKEKWSNSPVENFEYINTVCIYVGIIIHQHCMYANTSCYSLSSAGEILPF